MQHFKDVVVRKPVRTERSAMKFFKALKYDNGREKLYVSYGSEYTFANVWFGSESQ